MNPLLQLIEEQKKEFEYRFGLGLYTRYATQENEYKLIYLEMSDIVREFQTASIKAILQAQIEILEKSKTRFGSIDPIMQEVYQILNENTQIQIDLLTETINSLSEAGGVN